MSSKKIFVTRPFLPPFEEFLPYLEKIWHSGMLTNCGPFHNELEEKLCDYLGVEQLALCTNGSIGLLTALQALRISGEVITTPYSFVSTAHSLLWNNLTPVFVDIDPISLNLDPNRIEEAITPETTAIMPVHCYGTPCDIERIQEIANIYGLKVIYDAAHAFGVQYKGESLLKHGDLSVLSMHATKVFNTFEGGAIVCSDPVMKERIGYLKNFGFANEVTVTAAGINGKMSELGAAVGLLQLKHIDSALDDRRNTERLYREGFADVAGVSLLTPPADTVGNASYFPIFIGPEYPLNRDALYNQMRDHNIFGRRYFYPLISNMPMYRRLDSAAPENLPVAHQVANQVICLPLYPGLSLEEIERVIEAIREPNT